MVTLTTQPDFVLSTSPTGRSVTLMHDGNVWGVIVDSDIATDPGSPEVARVIGGVGATRLVVAHARPTMEEGRATLSWTRSSVEGLHAACRRWLSVIGPGVTLLLWPRADQIVSDIPSVWSLLRTLETERLGLVLDPDSMITESMREYRTEHLERFGESLASQPRTALVVDRGNLPSDFAAHLPRLRQPGVSGGVHRT
ncbi:MAG: hypothetical protein IT432_08180 [Phycisphaerales bacterium]|nr:hypothetical protein [Phycisphaerales bacterium]